MGQRTKSLTTEVHNEQDLTVWVKEQTFPTTTRKTIITASKDTCTKAQAHSGWGWISNTVTVNNVF